ncbi:fungal-specific transcription factor domain-containing protein [Cadophora sp. MPI-SDFR-AT-0126]|nr:fungal-specific transcription factor domain-containing protein [Leotiomycetes sp. MPI-SDFR-AT-0126]
MKRNLTCTYGEENGSEDIQASPKRRLLDSNLDTPKSVTLSPGHDNHFSNVKPPSRPEEKQHLLNGPSDKRDVSIKPLNAYQDDRSREKSQRRGSAGAHNSDESMALLSGTSNNTNGQEEEIADYTEEGRMLQDPTGRLLYIGDSAVLSFLQFIRMIVESVSGQSAFTQDPMRHKIVENTIALPANVRYTHLLPDRQTANVLVDSYFTNINGLIEVCHRKTFLTSLEQCYTDPLSIDPSWLCLLHLVFAIGLVMASPVPGSPEDFIIKKLRADRSVDRAEMFYANAKHLSDPFTGFEDSGFWSIQALTLMSVYMLAVSRRNAAYAFHGMAVRSAFAVGLHRKEAMDFFGEAEKSVRRNLWRTLFVLDRFLSTSLGRPTAIRESDCSGDTLMTGERAPFPQAPFPTAANASFTSPNAVGLEASVRSCHVIGVILEKVYSQRRISTKLAQEIADHCKGWPKALDPSLNPTQAYSASPSQGIAILHVNLLHCHSLILLTRPFFLFLMKKIYTNPEDATQRIHVSRMEKFAIACVVASNQSIALVQSARDSGYLSQRNPFVLYFLFAASLVVLSNEFCGLYQNPNAGTSMRTAINIMHYFSEQDPQARRLLVILTSFRDVVSHQQSIRARQRDAARASGVLPQSNPSLAEDNNDAMANLFQGSMPSSGNNLSLASPIAGVNTVRREPLPISFSPLNVITSQVNHNLSSPAQQDQCPISRQNSLDAFVDLARVASNPNSGGSNDGNESFAEEIDFEAFYNFPYTSSAIMTPGIVSGMTPGGILGESQLRPEEVQAISDSRVPMFGLTNMDFTDFQ